MTRPNRSAISLGYFMLRRVGDGSIGIFLPRPLVLRMQLRAGTKLRIEVKDGRIIIHAFGSRMLTRADLYRASACWPQMRLALRHTDSTGLHHMSARRSLRSSRWRL
jgi:antitoxin component of MazEF toxin-antitoxin module